MYMCDLWLYNKVVEKLWKCGTNLWINCV